MVCGVKNRKRSAFVLFLGTILVIGGAYGLSSGSGYPATNVTTATSFSCTSSTHTNSTGNIISTSYGCTENDYPVQNIPVALGSNLIVWVPLVGCICFSMPAWREGSPRYDKLARLLGGCVIGAAILMNLVGIGFSGSLQVLPPVHMPLNPFLATGECDSMTSIEGCVYANRLYVVADYGFWLVVVILASVATSTFVTYKTTSGARIRSGVVFSVLLALALFVGLVVIPASIAGSGILVNTGNSFSFYPDNSYVRVPFVAGSNETLRGDFRSNAAVNVYVLTTAQFESFDNGALCPGSSIAPLLVNATGGSLATRVGSGSYSLLFCSYLVGVPSIQITISSPLELSP